MKLANRAVLAVLLFFAVALYVRGASQTASDQPQDVMHSDQVLRTNTRLVVVDVVATDGKGRLIEDLKPGDLNMLEDGKGQKISNFTFHPPGQTLVNVSSRLPVNVVTNAPAFQASSLNVMLLDTLNGGFAEQAYVKDQLLKFLSRAQLTRPIALFAMEDRLVLLHDFTTDAAALKGVVEKFRPPARNNNAESVESRASAFTTHGVFHNNDRDIGTTLNQLNALAKTLAGYPGRKNLIWLSESFPVNLFPENMANGMSGVCSGDACGGGTGRQWRPCPRIEWRTNGLSHIYEFGIGRQRGRQLQRLCPVDQKGVRRTDERPGCGLCSGCRGSGQRRTHRLPRHHE